MKDKTTIETLQIKLIEISDKVKGIQISANHNPEKSVTIEADAEGIKLATKIVMEFFKND